MIASEDPETTNAAHDALHWERQLVDAVPRFGNGFMHQHFMTLAIPLATKLASASSCADEVRTQLQRRIAGGEPAMGEVARALGVSTRTLRRRLDDERVSYRALVDEVRRDLANQLLANANASITDVALDLGFADSTAFARAHRRWHGISPKAARRG